jgi:enoyl-CoA hydratase/carnithine racemase
MLFESRHLRITCDNGTATLWLGFPGEPVNALDLGRLREFDLAIAALAAHPSPRICVVRSAIPFGFCAGLRPRALSELTDPAERAAFAWYGQQVLDRLARLETVTVAFIDGPCIGVGLELALACDHRLCVARPDTRLGFPDRLACFGGSSRLRALLGRDADRFLSAGHLVSAREARASKLVDAVCCERRASIELRTFLDRLELCPCKPRPPVESFGWAAERRAFAVAVPPPEEQAGLESLLNPLPPFPSVVGLFGENTAAARLIAEAVLRGSRGVVHGNRAQVFAAIDASLSRGFVTPLEAETARLRVAAVDHLDDFAAAQLVFVGEDQDAFHLAASVRPRTVVAVVRPPGCSSGELAFPYPRRVVSLACTGDAATILPAVATAPDTTLTLSSWLRSLHCDVRVVQPASPMLPTELSLEVMEPEGKEPEIERLPAPTRRERVLVEQAAE